MCQLHEVMPTLLNLVIDGEFFVIWCIFLFVNFVILCFSSVSLTPNERHNLERSLLCNWHIETDFDVDLLSSFLCTDIEFIERMNVDIVVRFLVVCGFKWIFFSLQYNIKQRQAAYHHSLLNNYFIAGSFRLKHKSLALHLKLHG